HLTRYRDQKAESAEEARNKFSVHEIGHDGLRLILRSAAPSVAFLVGPTILVVARTGGPLWVLVA
ncbi:MAG TPA: hypothetical protein VI455_08615, partial [Terriglobia bacterium]